MTIENADFGLDLGPASALDDSDLVRLIHYNIDLAKDVVSDWRDSARDSFDFVSGKQWREDDAARLEELGRPVVTFNRVGPFIRAIVGHQINTRQELRFVPREMGDVVENELLTEAAKWISDSTNQQDEETDAFQDLIITGMGWTETFMDYTEDPDGLIRIERRSPLKMIWDPSANRANLNDRRWHAHEEWMSRQAIKEQWPDKADQILPSDLSSDSTDHPSVHISRPERRYDDDVDKSWHNKRLGLYKVIRYQWWELEDYYRVADPASGKIVELSVSKFSKMRDGLEALGIQWVRQKRRRYYQCFISGGTLLERGDSPNPKGFTFNVMTGLRDELKNSWYGIVRAMQDPQVWANKYFSQIQHIMATSSKGGLLYESDAFEDPRDAEEKWGSSDGLIELRPGGLSKIQEKPKATYPVGLDRLMEFAIKSFHDVTGVNLELLGMRNATQAGVLEAQRTQQSLTILAVFFNAFRRYKHEHGKLLLYFILTYLTDGRLIRITGEQTEKYVPLVRQQGLVEYDVIVDEQPASVNQKERTWAVLVSLIPDLMKQGIPVPPDILDYSPLPSTLTQKWKKYISDRSEQPDPGAEAALEKTKAETGKLKAESAKLMTQADLDRTKAAKEGISTMHDLVRPIA